MGNTKKSGFMAQRRMGWGMDLYRNRSESWVAGICAGLADHWNVPNWMVRVATVTLFIFTGSLAFWGYVAGVVCLAPRRVTEEFSSGAATEYDDLGRRHRSGKASRYSVAPTDSLRNAQARLDAALDKVEHMERYVTSRRYDLNRKFSEL